MAHVQVSGGCTSALSAMTVGMSAYKGRVPLILDWEGSRQSACKDVSVTTLLNAEKGSLHHHQKLPPLTWCVYESSS